MYRACIYLSNPSDLYLIRAQIKLKISTHHDRINTLLVSHRIILTRIHNHVYIFTVYLNDIYISITADDGNVY